MKDSDDRIEKVIEMDAPVARVWRALTDSEEFGQWFRVKLDGPFKPGAVSTGKMTYPGFEGWPWLATVERMEPERLFSFRWHDYDSKSGVPMAKQPTTLVEFRLQPIPRGTRLDHHGIRHFCTPGAASTRGPAEQHRGLEHPGPEHRGPCRLVRLSSFPRRGAGVCRAGGCDAATAALAPARRPAAIDRAAHRRARAHETGREQAPARARRRGDGPERADRARKPVRLRARRSRGGPQPPRTGLPAVGPRAAAAAGIRRGWLGSADQGVWFAPCSWICANASRCITPLKVASRRKNLAPIPASYDPAAPST